MKDDYTNEMMNWWLLEKDLIDKMETILIPRFADIEEPYTNLFRLPKMNYLSSDRGPRQKFTTSHIAVIELKGMHI